MGSSPVAVTYTSDFAPASSTEFLDIHAAIECGFTLKRIRGMIRTYSQIKRGSYEKEGCLIFWLSYLQNRQSRQRGLIPCLLSLLSNMDSVTSVGTTIFIKFNTIINWGLSKIWNSKNIKKGYLSSLDNKRFA